MDIASRITQGRLLSLVFIAGLVLFAGFVNNASAQMLCPNGLGPCRSPQADSFIFLSSDREFELGRKVAVCLMNDCTILVGNITNVKFDPDSPMVNIHFIVTESLDGFEVDNIQREADFGWSTNRLDFPFDVLLEPGSQLMIGKRPNGSYVDFALGNAKYFSSIRSAVIFNSGNDLQESFGSALGALKGQGDSVFAGYLTENFWRMAARGNIDEHLTVLGQLMTDPNFPSLGRSMAAFGIRLILQHEATRPTDSARDESIRKLFEIALSDDNEERAAAISVLENVADREWFQPRRYLDRSEARKLILNIHKLPSPNGTTSALEKKLSKTN